VTIVGIKIKRIPYNITIITIKTLKKENPLPVDVIKSLYLWLSPFVNLIYCSEHGLKMARKSVETV